MFVWDSVFFVFWAWKKKWAWKPFFALFSFFSRAKFEFHARVFRVFSVFSRALFVFTGTFSVFFTGKKNGFTGKNLRIFTGSFFFHGHFWTNPTQLLLVLPIFVWEKITQMGFFYRGACGGGLPIPHTNTAILLEFFFSELTCNVPSVLALHPLVFESWVCLKQYKTINIQSTKIAGYP